jgi:hypothetical protein
MDDRYLEKPDFWCELRFADSGKRALIRHFDRFLHQQIDNRGFGSRDPKLFNQDTIAGQAWDLADKAIDAIAADFADAWEVIVDGQFNNISAWVVAALKETIEEVEREYLADELMGVNGLIEMASGTPINISGTDYTIDFGMGPGEDD